MIIEEQHNITCLESSNKSKDNILKEVTESRHDNNAETSKFKGPASIWKHDIHLLMGIEIGFCRNKDKH